MENKNHSSKLHFYSWNVLHIIHELNYCFDNSLILDKYQIVQDPSNEQKRLKEIMNMINTFMKNDNTFILLQEVPYDLFQLIEKQANQKESKFGVYAYFYTRIPINRSKLADSYQNTSECLVTIYPRNLGDFSEESVIFDASKACQIISNNRFCVINVHLPFGKNRAQALKIIFQSIDEKYQKQQIIMGGDMNMTYQELKQEINKTDLSIVKTNHYTRKWIENNKIRTQTIDFFMTTDQVKVISRKSLIDNDLSDHYPIYMNVYV